MAEAAEKPVLVCLTPGGLDLAMRVQGILGGGEIHVFAPRLAGRADGVQEFSHAGAHLRRLFQAGRGILGFCASGILIRALGPVLADKMREPPVISIAEDASSIVPLLGGHHGANDLARRLADALCGHAAITTAGELGPGVALDAPPVGWHVGNPARARAVMAALIAGEHVRLDRQVATNWPPEGPFQDGKDDAGDGADCWTVRVTIHANNPDHDHGEDARDARTLTLHPPMLALGVGCERDAGAEGLIGFVRASLRDANLAAQAIVAVGSIDLKADEPAIRALAAELDRPLRLFGARELEKLTPRLANPSERVFQEVGCHGVAEGAALALADGRDMDGDKHREPASLLMEKRRAGPYTLAVAQAVRPLVSPVAAPLAGRGVGWLSLVGIGPGDAAWRTGECVAALARAEIVVGYGLYLDLVADLIDGKTRIDSPLGEERGRAQQALSLAAEGREVALVCSGDPGIYALATLVFQLIEGSESRALNGVTVTVVPGISAFQAAAARLGAPVGHDFCLISLSDLLTPRDVILARLQAAAAADFVVCLYNPQSARRRDLLGEGLGILVRARPATTPVAVCRNLGRVGETVQVTTLSQMEPGDVDMFSLVLVGNSRSRQFRQAGQVRLFTPRGYAMDGDGAGGDNAT